MNELVKLVAKKTGMNDTVAQIAVSTVISSLKTKLPANIGNMLESYLSSGSSTSKSTKSDNPLGNLGNVVGSLLGGKK